MGQYDIMKTYLLEKERYNNKNCCLKKGGRYGGFKTNQKVQVFYGN